MGTRRERGTGNETITAVKRTDARRRNTVRRGGQRRLEFANVRNVEVLGKGFTYLGHLGSVYIKRRISNAFLNASQIIEDPS